MTPTATPEPDDDNGDERPIKGIPDDNPVFEPDDDGECEKHETRVKTTPSGEQVNVPCHAAENSENAGPPDDVPRGNDD